MQEGGVWYGRKVYWDLATRGRRTRLQNRIWKRMEELKQMQYLLISRAFVECCVCGRHSNSFIDAKNITEPPNLHQPLYLSISRYQKCLISGVCPRGGFTLVGNLHRDCREFMLCSSPSTGTGM